MAKVKKNIMMSGLSGSLGPDHYARVTKDGTTIPIVAWPLEDWVSSQSFTMAKVNR